MKKFIVTALVVLLCCMPLCACSTDFSAEITEGMDSFYSMLRDSFELFFKEAGNEGDGSGEEDAPIIDGGNENQGNENQGNEGGNAGENEITPDGGNDNEEKYEIGTSVGKKLPSYSVEIFDENGVSGEFIDPSALGKVTVINFWGTWCPPCVGELPEFSKVATEYKNEVTIVAIHSVNNFKEGAVSHIKNNFSDSDIIFARDVDLGEGVSYFDECYEAFGGNGYYPYTIIINEKGVITYAKEGALSEFQLKTQLEIALGN